MTLVRRHHAKEDGARLHFLFFFFFAAAAAAAANAHTHTKAGGVIHNV